MALVIVTECPPHTPPVTCFARATHRDATPLAEPAGRIQPVGEVADGSGAGRFPFVYGWSRSIVARTPTGPHELPLLRSVLGARQPPARHHAGAAADLLQPDPRHSFYLAARTSPRTVAYGIAFVQVCPSDPLLIARVFTRAGCWRWPVPSSASSRRCVLRDRQRHGRHAHGAVPARGILLGSTRAGHRPTGRAGACSRWPRRRVSCPGSARPQALAFPSRSPPSSLSW